MIKAATIISMLMLVNSAMAEDFDEPTRPFVAKKEKKAAAISKSLEGQNLAASEMTKQVAEQIQKEVYGAELLNKASLSVANGENSITVDALSYTLKLGDDVSLPFMVYTTTPTKSTISKEKVSSSILDIRGGVLNFSIGNRSAEDYKIHGNKICEFADPKSGGCFWNWRLGAKMVEAPSQTGNNTSYLYSGFASLGIKADFPVYDQTETKAGYLVFDLQANAHYMNADKISILYTEKPKNAFASLDAGLTFYIQNQLSVAVGGTLGSSDSGIGKSSYVRFSLSGQ